MTECRRVLAALSSAFLLLLSLIPAVSAGRPNITEGNTLPVLEINVEPRKPIVKDVYRTADLILRDGTEETVYSMQIRGRGNSTWGQSKKPYHIRLDEITDLFGMGESRHWVLLANAYDGSHLRNKLSCDLSAAMGMPAVRSVHVNVILNGRYVGLYQLSESIRAEKGRVPIHDWEDSADDAAYAIGRAHSLSDEDIASLAAAMKTDLSWITSGEYGGYVLSNYLNADAFDTTGGYLLELDEYYDERSRFRTPENVPVMVKSPEYLNTNDEMFGYIRDWICEMEEAMVSSDGYNSLGKHYTEYIDMDSFIDYWLVNELFKSVELQFKSCFMYKPAGEKLYFGPVWDMDWSSGNRNNLSGDAADPCTWTNEHMMAREIWYRALYDQPDFVTAAGDRWWEIRPLIDDMMVQLDTLADELTAAAADNQNAWKTRSFEDEVDQLRNWLTQRTAWLDSQFALRDPDIAGYGFRENTSVVLTLTDSSGVETENPPLIDSPAAADFHVTAGAPLTVSVEFPVKNTSAALYLNGIRVGDLPSDTGLAQFTLDPALLKTDSSRNVVLAIVHRGSTETGKAYLTLSADPPLPDAAEETVPADAPAEIPADSSGSGDENTFPAASALTVLTIVLLAGATVFLLRRK